jgi:MotA/TolQ/ExbB proton channel family
MEQEGLLKAKFIAFNITSFSLWLILWSQGYMDRIFHGNVAIAAMIITMVFLLGLVMTAYRVWKVGAELDRVKRGQGRIITMESERALEIRLFSRISHIQHIANALGLLGLIGTAWGFSLFASNITADQVGNAAAAGALVSTLAGGIGVAIYATMIGGILCLWTTCNLQLLRGATASLCASIMDAARDPRPNRAVENSPVVPAMPETPAAGLIEGVRS